MKKAIIIAVVVALIGAVIFLIYGFFVKDYSGDSYYTQVINSGVQETDKDTSGVNHIRFRYQQLGFNSKGQEKALDFFGNKEVPLRKEAYLKVVYNDKKGVVSWEEVEEKDVPAPALDKLKAIRGLQANPSEVPLTEPVAPSITDKSTTK